MKICFILQDTGRIYGAQRATLDLIEGLQQSGTCETHVLLFREIRSASGPDQYRKALGELAGGLETVWACGTTTR